MAERRATREGKRRMNRRALPSKCLVLVKLLGNDFDNKKRKGRDLKKEAKGF